MQIYALDDQANLCHAQIAKRGASYRCPECLQALRPRSGPFRKPHFYHIQISNCRLYGKSLVHLNIQYALQKMLAPETIQLEQRFPQIGRVADVVWEEKKLIFECQVSPISAEEIKQRNMDYGKMGYQVIWILHDRRFNKAKMSDAEIALRHSPHYFTNINSLGKGSFYDQLSSIHFKRRLKLSRQIPLGFQKPIYIYPNNLKNWIWADAKAPERERWGVCFEGDVTSLTLSQGMPKGHFSTIGHRLFRPYRILLHLLLEKTTD